MPAWIRVKHLKLGGSDLIRVVCHQCGGQGVCPSLLGPPRSLWARELRVTNGSGTGSLQLQGQYIHDAIAMSRGDNHARILR